MKHWRRTLLACGFEWTSRDTATRISLQVQDNRWMAVLDVRMPSGEAERYTFFAEDGYDASLQKCLSYVWRALSLTDRSSFDPREAWEDLRRFVARF